jgi:hypothetical protein
MIDDRVGDCGDVGYDKDGDGMFNGIRGGGDGGGITEVGGRQMSAWENWAPVVEEPPHSAATPRPNAKQMGRDPDTYPKMLYLGGFFHRRSAMGVRGNTMVCSDLLGASPW